MLVLRMRGGCYGHQAESSKTEVPIQSVHGFLEAEGTDALLNN